MQFGTVMNNLATIAILTGILLAAFVSWKLFSETRERVIIFGSLIGSAFWIVMWVLRPSF